METIGGTITEASQQVLEGLDFEIPCSHGDHDSDTENHEGDAAFIVHLHARCDCSGPVPICARFVENMHTAEHWLCVRCGSSTPASECSWTIRPINGPL